MKSEHWLKAMDIESLALIKNGIWTLVHLPPRVKPVGSKWVYTIKYHSDETIERCKARLVAKGYN
jgi:hypothetical protein